MACIIVRQCLLVWVIFVQFSLESLAAPTEVTRIVSGPAPVLLELEPESGPIDGGTRVRLNAFGLNVSQDWYVSFFDVADGYGQDNETARLVAPLQIGADGIPFFVTPDFTRSNPDAAASLIFLATSNVSTNNVSSTGSVADPLVGPLFFRLLARLAELAPTKMEPCCELKVSGGEELSLSGRMPASALASSHAVVRFRSESGHQQEVLGTLSQAFDSDGDPVSVSNDDDAWQLHAVAPSWPRAEGHVVLEVSWNRQQFTKFGHTVRFVEEESFFGDMAGGISEEHVPQPEQMPIAAPPEGGARDVGDEGFDEGQEWVVSVVDDHEGLPPQAGHSPDLSHVVLMDDEGDSFVLSRARDVTHLQEDFRFVRDLFLLTCAATVGGGLAAQVYAPSVLGFLVGGAAVGPGGLNAIVELVQVESISGLGVVLLLFCLGLELSWTELLHNTRAALAGVLSMVALCGAIVFVAIFCTETPVHEAVCIALFAALSSTHVSLRTVPMDASVEQKAQISVLLAILVVQDMALACLLAVLPRIFSAVGHHRPHHHSPPEKLPGAPAHASLSEGNELYLLGFLMCAQLAVIAVGCMRRHALANALQVVHQSVCEKLLRLSDEFFVLVILSYAFVSAYASDHFGLSVELGSFVAGLLLSSVSHDASERALHMLVPLKDFFAALFFASIGLVVNGRFLIDNFAAVLSVVGFVFVLKIFTAFPPIRLLASGSSPSPSLMALRVSCVLAHVGEFGFVLAAKGAALGVLSRHVYLLLVGANAVSLCLAPWLFWTLEWSMPKDIDLPGPIWKRQSKQERKRTDEDVELTSYPVAARSA